MKTPEQIAEAIVPVTDAATYRKGAVQALVIEAIEADRAQREANPFSVGDPDPTPDGENNCEAVSPENWFCTWPEGHPGQHVAGTGERIAAVWS